MFKNSIYFLLIIILFWSCSSSNFKRSYENLPELDEVEIVDIPLLGEISKRKSEISGLCWYKDFLLILPQYPQRFNGKIFYVRKSTILNFLNGKINAIRPNSFAVNISEVIKYFHLGSGFEAVAAKEDTLFFTIEDLNQGLTQSILLKGKIDTLSKKITLDSSTIAINKPEISLSNISDESLLIAKDILLPIYEANGKLINQKPYVQAFSLNIKPLRKISFPNIEYRITDVTEIDSNNKFWAINYLFPGDIEKLKVSNDSLFFKYGIGKTHKILNYVERIVQLQYSENKITLVNRKPIYLRLNPDDSRNWEGIAKIDNLGFILATDTYPKTILAFVKFP